jgi:hypothetical protein
MNGSGSGAASLAGDSRLRAQAGSVVESKIQIKAG